MKYKIYKTYYYISDDMFLVGECTNKKEISTIIDLLKNNLEKNDKIKIEVYENRNLIDRIFICDKEIVESLHLKNLVKCSNSKKEKLQKMISDNANGMQDSIKRIIEEPYLDDISLKYIIKIAELLDCRIEDLYEYEF